MADRADPPGRDRMLQSVAVHPLLPLPKDRLPMRWAMLAGGLVLYGASCGLILQADLGVDPWDVLHQGLSRTFGGQVGTWTIAVSLVVLLLWLPLRGRFGVYMPPLMEALGLAEVTHDAKNNKMRAL